MKEGVVLHVNGHEQWWWGNETAVPDFETAFMEIRSLFKRALYESDYPVFFHSHPAGFTEMSRTDLATCRDLLFALRQSFLFVVITPSTCRPYWCDRQGVISQLDDKLSDDEDSTRIITKLREMSYE